MTATVLKKKTRPIIIPKKSMEATMKASLAVTTATVARKKIAMNITTIQQRTMRATIMTRTTTTLMRLMTAMKIPVYQTRKKMQLI